MRPHSFVRFWRYISCYLLTCLFFLVRQGIFELHWPIVAKFCTVVGNVSYFKMQIHNFGAFPRKNLGAKNMQKLAWFPTTSNFDNEYLQNRRRFKIGQVFDLSLFLLHSPKCRVNFGPVTLEIWRPNHTHPNRLFWETIFFILFFF